jgi:hypothetical protein
MGLEYDGAKKKAIVKLVNHNRENYFLLPSAQVAEGKRDNGLDGVKEVDLGNAFAPEGFELAEKLGAIRTRAESGDGGRSRRGQDAPVVRDGVHPRRRIGREERRGHRCACSTWRKFSIQLRQR